MKKIAVQAAAPAHHRGWRVVGELLAEALCLTLLVEMLGRRSVESGLLFLLKTPVFFLLNMLIVLVTLAWTPLVKKGRAWRITIGVLWSLLALANCVTMIYRGSPLAAVDFFLLRSTWTMLYTYLTPGLLACALLALLLLVGGLTLLFCRMPAGRPEKKWSVGILAGSIAALGLSLLLLWGSKLLPRQFEDMAQDYERYGFNYCFAVSLLDRGIAQPEQYSAETIQNILRLIGADASQPAEQTPNVIFLQLESFMDLSRLRGITCSEDPTPMFTALKQQYPHGWLDVPSLGGGTANTEFEVLTGMALQFFGTGEYPYETILQTTACESICFNLKQQNYVCHAVHDHSGSFYQRNLVYPNLGFDTFTSLEYMNGVEMNPAGWAKDAVLTSQIRRALDSTPGQDFVFAVSVQGHGKYPREKTDLQQTITVSGAADEGRQTELEYYAGQLHEMDAFVAELLQMLEEYQEPTVLVLYGDHLPALELQAEDLSRGGLYQSEYVIWSNFALSAAAGEQKNTAAAGRLGAAEPLENRDLKAYQLSAWVLECLGMDDGLFTKLHQRYSGETHYLEALNLLEYDVLYGDLSAYAGNTVYAPTQMQMGAEPILLQRLWWEGEDLYISGGPFTPYSIAAVNDKWKETEFLDEQTLCLRGLDAVEESWLTVSQVGADGKTLSATEAVALPQR